MIPLDPEAIPAAVELDAVPITPGIDEEGPKPAPHCEAREFLNGFLA
jgi:hypothetical protein